MARSSRLLFFTAIAALPVLAACNAILGIDDFDRTECGPRPCPFDATPDQNPFDNFVPDSGRDTGTDAPPGVGPAVWPEFEMPNYHKDAGGLGLVPRPLAYNPISADIVEDTVTKLVWRRAVIGANFGDDFKQDDARAACQKLDPGTGPWRLPKRIELVTLLSHGFDAGAPFVDRTIFTNVPADAVWTSSEVRPLTPGAQKYWIVDFNTGAVGQLAGAGAQGAKALCVRDKK